MEYIADFPFQPLCHIIVPSTGQISQCFLVIVPNRLLLSFIGKNSQNSDVVLRFNKCRFRWYTNLVLQLASYTT